MKILILNIGLTDEFFSETPDWEEKSGKLAKALVSIWKAKLKRDFSNINFTVEYLCNEEVGDYGLTFYQTDKENIQQLKNIVREISTPNIKESKIEQSSYGPRPGIPKIRKPRADEIP